MKAARWMEPPQQPATAKTYEDPQGEPYKGLTNFIQTPMNDPVKPVITVDEGKRVIEHKFKLRAGK